MNRRSVLVGGLFFYLGAALALLLPKKKPVAWVVETKDKNIDGIYTERSDAVKRMKEIGPSSLFPVFLNMKPDERRKQNIRNG